MEKQSVSPKHTGILVVDVQADFTELESGSLAVPGTDAQYIDAVQKSTQRFLQQGFQIYFTQDWHPADHMSFYTNNPDTEPLQIIEIEGRPQVMWPPHCVQGTQGAEIIVTVDASAKTMRKGMDSRFDSYSGFTDDGGHKTELDNVLRQDSIHKLIIYGLATDYCVKATVMDALEGGYQVDVNLDLCRGVSQETTESAIREMKASGAIILGS
jgi:nicotinamidase/pyrazinamidase